MRTKILVLSLVCLFTISCIHTTPSSQFNKYRVKFVETHPFLMSEERDPELLSKMRDAILNGEVLLGMNIMQVQASRGVPGSINTDTSERGTHSQWVYVNRPIGHHSRKEWLLDRKYAYIFFENGIVISWQGR